MVKASAKETSKKKQPSNCRVEEEFGFFMVPGIGEEGSMVERPCGACCCSLWVSVERELWVAGLLLGWNAFGIGTGGNHNVLRLGVCGIF